MPWIKLTTETKQLIAQNALPERDYLPEENDRGEIFIPGEIFEELKNFSPDMDEAIQYLCRARQ